MSHKEADGRRRDFIWNHLDGFPNKRAECKDCRFELVEIGEN